MVIDRALTFVRGIAEAPKKPSAAQLEVAKLFDQWRDPLLGYLVRLGLPIQDGEEVLQEVFLALFQHLQQNRSDSNLRGWVFRVGHNLALKRRYAPGTATHEPNGAAEWQDPEPNPEEALAIKQRQARLMAVVNSLAEQDRCCLHLRAEGLRYREIAAVLGISVGTVALCLSRSLERLRRADR